MRVPTLAILITVIFVQAPAFASCDRIIAKLLDRPFRDCLIEMVDYELYSAALTVVKGDAGSGQIFQLVADSGARMNLFPMGEGTSLTCIDGQIRFQVREGFDLKSTGVVTMQSDDHSFQLLQVLYDGGRNTTLRAKCYN